MTKFFRFIALAFLVAFLSLSSSHAEVSSRAVPSLETATIQTPLSTRGDEIVDRTGRTVLLRGVNWFGLETEAQTPHGLWARDYKEMLAQIKGLGYNMIRLPYSVKGLRATTVSGINFDLGSNQELQGKTPLEVMDAIVQEAERQGLMILLDSHRLNNTRIPELWYGDGFTETDWIDTWIMLAERYKNQPNVIGADLKNEPHGKASWGTNDKATDWRLAAERAGNAILKVNKNWLIVVEGVEKNVPRQKLKQHWMGGNLEGVRKFPVRLAVRNKVVYSPHEYGAGVFDQPWFAERSFPKNLSDRWEKGFYYIARQKIAPILIGEFGGRKVDAESKEGIWQRQFVAFVKRNQLSFAYWSWNPNSADTGGILLDDWNAIDEPKQALLNQLLPASRLRSLTEAVLPKPSLLPSPAINPISKPISRPISSTNPGLKPTLNPQPTINSPVPRAGKHGKTPDLNANLMLQSDWKEGFCASLEVRNPNRVVVSNWQLKFLMHQAAVSQSWNGTFEKQDLRYTVTPPDWGRDVQPNQTISMGFCAKKLGTDYLPRQITVTSSKQL
ncbi:cellulase family glycosylhydrolase [Myxacorys almedinensis]|uniref:Endoglucanase n=1 Tax=Myxacorys almedinensis A TaxID=2690445 RepID=A0A8J8CLX0_9CYAN|nr:cellulase family glycosylhydrolase [Myxacorys almedinensis]NDJ16577.1 cellulase family glycosylhydrolase [Myxacorys almedinensis A]